MSTKKSRSPSTTSQSPGAKSEAQKTKRTPSPAHQPPKKQRPSIKPRPKGKIASLPQAQRDIINHLLLDGATYSKVIRTMREHKVSLNHENVSNWQRGPHQDWLKEQQWREDTRSRHKDVAQLIDKLDPSKANQAALYIATLQIFDALRGLATTGLNDKLDGDCAAYARLINALSRASKETLALQKHSELRDQKEAQAQAPTPILNEDGEITCGWPNAFQ